MAFDLAAALQQAAFTGVLSLSYVGLSHVPAQVFDLPLLRRLDLSNNEIRSLPPDLGKLRNLEQLWLNDNPLESLPDEIEGCVSLRHLDVRNTSLRKLPSILGRLDSIIEMNLLNTKLEPEVQEVYAKGGTLKLLSYLNTKEGRRDLENALRNTLTVDVYAEAADSTAGRAAVEALVAGCMAEFTDNDELRTCIRNAGRLFNTDLHRASAYEARQRYLDLVRDNMRKAMGADIELTIRALYYDKVEITKVETIVADILSALPTLEDAQFLVEHARKLFPANWKDLSGKLLYESLVALRTAIARDRAAAVQSLVTSLANIYSDREPSHIQHLASSVAALLKSADDIRMLASDAAELFPPEFSAARAKKVFAAFKESKKEKGL